MKTRSGLILLPTSWPCLNRVREYVPEDIQTVRQLFKFFSRSIPDIKNKKIKKRRFLFLVLSETILKYALLLDCPDGQYMVNAIIKSLETAHVKEYTHQFKVLSDWHRMAAIKRYVEFFFTGLTCPDVARHVAGFLNDT